MVTAMTVEGNVQQAGDYALLRGGVTLTHFFLRQRVLAEDVAVDATCGNGKDTLFLARLVGPEGTVFALDTDPRAIEATVALLRSEGVEERVVLLNQGHEKLATLVTVPVAAVVFNLGYLPGADGGGQPTSTLTTLAGLTAALGLLAPGGILLVCIYTGHDGGEAEALAVEAWGEGLPPREWNVWKCRQLNRPAIAPYLMLVEKNVSGSR
jgi:hypothetical protein